MTSWTCPDCGGGFPEPVPRVDHDEAEVWGCPWCGRLAEMFDKRDLDKIREQQRNQIEHEGASQ